MAEPVKAEMVFVKEECGGLEVKEELVEEQDPLSLVCSYILEYIEFMICNFYFFTSINLQHHQKCKHMYISKLCSFKDESLH